MKRRFKRLDFIGKPNYKISNYGKLYCLHGDFSRGIPYEWRRVQIRPNSNWKRHGAKPYLRVRIAGKQWLLQRLVLEVFIGPCPEGMEARHLDGDIKNNRLDNLKWGTRKQNAKDKVRHGRGLKGKPRLKNRGEKNGVAVYTNEIATKIRSEYIPKIMTYRMLAKKYGGSHWTIRDVVKGLTYSDD